MRILWHMPVLRSKSCGLSIRALKMARRLTEFGHSISFLARRDRCDADGDRIGGMPVRTVNLAEGDARVGMIHWSLQARARIHAARRMVDAVTESHDLFVSCQPEAVSAYREARPSAPLVFVCGGTTILHDASDARRHAGRSMQRRLGFGLDRVLKHRNEARAFHAADRVIFNSASTRRAVIDFYHADPVRCHVVYGGADADYFRSPDPAERAASRRNLGIEEREFVVAWTGRISVEKNVDLLIRAAARSAARPRVLIVGDGDLRHRLSVLAGFCGIADRVTFTGSVSDVRSALFAADAFVFPSIGESFGDSLAEAMSCGLACIALRANGSTIRNASGELLDNGRCGLLVDGLEPGSLGAAMDRLASEPAERRRLGDAAARRARALFTWSAGGTRLNALLSGLVPCAAEPAECGTSAPALV